MKEVGQKPSVTKQSLNDAAYEMYEVLRDLVESPNAKQNDMWDRARKAIAKAERRSL